MVTRRTYLAATVGPAASYVIDREVGRALERKALDLAAAQPEVARQLRLAVEQMRESGRAWFEGEVGSPRQAGRGSSEVPEMARGAGSEHLLVADFFTVGEVAVRLGISDRQVRNLIHSKDLTATFHRGRWVIDTTSVAMEVQRRGLA